MERKKPRVAIHSVTGCAGCQLTIYFIKDQLLDFFGTIDLVAAPMIKGKNSEGPYDICFVEGSITSKRDLEAVKKWREQSKTLVAFGTCATHANVQGILHFRAKQETQKKVYWEENPECLKGEQEIIGPDPIEKHVEVDYKISGCPPDEKEFLRFIKEYLVGMNPRIYEEPVCVECTKREIRCLLEDGKECLGPLIRGGCNALCPAVKHGCTGCHGPIREANIKQAAKIMVEAGIPIKRFQQMINKYSGTTFEETGANLREEIKKYEEIIKEEKNKGEE